MIISLLGFYLMIPKIWVKSNFYEVQKADGKSFAGSV